MLQYLQVDENDVVRARTKGRDTQGVRRHIVGGENRTLISVKTPLRLCRTGTCRKLSAERPQIVVALFERQLVLLLK